MSLPATILTSRAEKIYYLVMPSIPRKQTPDPSRRKQERATPQDKRYWSNAWRKLRGNYLKKYPICKVCGKLANVVDHITPVRLGGSFWDTSNMQPLCTSCHNSKSGKEARLYVCKSVKG